jgi:hypothetical protein
MTVTDNVFPQSGDNDYAENFATWLGRGNVSDYVETGMTFTPDYGNDELDIAEGKAYLIVDEATISSNNETRLVLDYTITTSEKTNITLNASETTNYIYLNPNIGTNDSPSFEVETDTAAAGADWLLIGVVDTVNDSFEYRNRDPDADFNTLTARDTLEIPSYSDTADAESSESSTIYIDGSGSEKAGIYIYDGSEYITAGVREINDLNDVTGVESITADSSGNRPTAGTQGQVFIDESNDKLQFDDGSSWVDIGTKASNIEAGDLGFNFAFGLEQDGNGDIQIDEDTSFTFTASQIINDSLTLGGNLDLQNHNIVEPAQFQTDGTGSDNISFRDVANSSNILTLREGGEVEVNSGDLTDGTTVIFDQSETHIPTSILQDNSLSVLGGDGLKSGGSVSLGSSVTLDIEPADFAGTFLSDDGADNLTVNLGDGLEDSGAGQIQLDEDYPFVYTSEIQFNGGLDTRGNIEDDTTVIWNSTNSYIEQTALQNDSLTVTAGDGLKNGGTVALGSSTTVDVEPADFAGAHLSDDGSDNLSVDDDFVLNSGDSISGALNFSNSSAIQDAGVNAITFDGNRNVTVPNGDLTVAGTITEQDSL